MNRLTVALSIFAITLLTYYQFPGHTWLQQDSQIYTPILEHLWDPGTLANDILAQHPHVTFTLYDETAIALRRVLRADFHSILAAQQFLFRGLGLWGIYLIASAIGLSTAPSLLATAIWGLGATIAGPAVLTIEYEPVPRGFAVPLLFLAVGLVAHGRDLWAGVAAGVAFLMHPPTAYPFWAVYFVMALWRAKPTVMRRHVYGLVPMIGAALVLLVASTHQAGAHEAQQFFTRLTPDLENLQRMRASYNWISIWWRSLLAQYIFLFAAAMLAYWRVRKQVPPDLRFFLIGLPAIGMLSMPLSWLLLEKMKWALIPQFQPMRALLFVTAIAVLLAAIAGCAAARARRFAEAFAWFGIAYLVPIQARVLSLPSWDKAAVVIALALAACLVGAARSGHVVRFGTAAVAVLAYFAIPMLAHVRNHPTVHNPEIAELSRWARASTGSGAVFLFPDFAHGQQPGIFRSEALRAVYVDWKGGGQVNYLKELADEWWSRWQAVMAKPFDPADTARYRGLGIDYLVLMPKNELTGETPVHRNSQFVVYEVKKVPPNPG